jgi:hypothetical protein
MNNVMDGSACLPECQTHLRLKTIHHRSGYEICPYPPILNWQMEKMELQLICGCIFLNDFERSLPGYRNTGSHRFGPLSTICSQL